MFIRCCVVYNSSMSNDIDIPEKSGEKQEKKDTRFKPGVSGNPAGKPKGTRHFATIIKDALKQKYPVKQPDGSIVFVNADLAMVQAMIMAAVKKGDVRAFEAVTDRHDGKPHQSMEMEITEPPIPIMPIKRTKKP